MTSGSIKRMLKKALLENNGTQFRSGGVFTGKPASPVANKPVATGTVSNPVTPQTYDQSTQISAQQTPAANGTQNTTGSQQATTSGNPINNNSFMGALKGMFLPSSGSNQDMGQWFGSPMGKMMTPLIESSGPMAIPALSWMQQMMSGDTSRWQTLTAGPGGVKSSSVSSVKAPISSQISSDLLPKAKGQTSTTTSVQAPSTRISSGSHIFSSPSAFYSDNKDVIEPAALFGGTPLVAKAMGSKMGPAGLLVGAGLEAADIATSPGGFNHAFGQKGQKEYDDSTTSSKNSFGYLGAAGQAISNPIRSTYSMGRNLVYDPHARNGKSWFPVLTDLYDLTTSGNLGLLFK